MSGWRKSRPQDIAWRAPDGFTRQQRALEQDLAAGGRNMRAISLPDGRIASASIALRVLPKGRRIYAYLRWSDRCKTTERYVGEVSGATRAENLAEAWTQVLQQDVLRAFRLQGRPTPANGPSDTKVSNGPSSTVSLSVGPETMPVSRDQENQT
jgi:DNA mismatch endonuclease (patch repair protein)